jgi:hypothetical protein
MPLNEFLLVHRGQTGGHLRCNFERQFHLDPTGAFDEFFERFPFYKLHRVEVILAGSAQVQHRGNVTKAIQPFLDSLRKDDWNKVSADLLKMADASEKMVQKMGPIADWFGKDIADEIDTLAKITTAIEGVATAIEKAFAWVVNLGGGNQSHFDAFQFTKSYQESGYHMPTVCIGRHRYGTY